jgi:hypothetical protein
MSNYLQIKNSYQYDLPKTKVKSPSQYDLPKTRARSLSLLNVRV